jgi:hypothetical protein
MINKPGDVMQQKKFRLAASICLEDHPMGCVEAYRLRAAHPPA